MSPCSESWDGRGQSGSAAARLRGTCSFCSGRSHAQGFAGRCTKPPPGLAAGRARQPAGKAPAVPDLSARDPGALLVCRTGADTTQTPRASCTDSPLQPWERWKWREGDGTHRGPAPELGSTNPCSCPDRARFGFRLPSPRPLGAACSGTGDTGSPRAGGDPPGAKQAEHRGETDEE